MGALVAPVGARPRPPAAARAAAGADPAPGDPRPAGKPTLFVFGLGYTGLAAARHLQRAGWDVAGTARGAARAAALAAAGVPAHAFDPGAGRGLGAAGEAALRRARAVLSTVPPDGGDDPVLAACGGLLLALAVGEAGEPGPLRWAGYVSSTSVYGDHGGAWVTEASELRAPGGKGLARALAEARWARLAAAGLPAHLLRCGGIYGPGRSLLDAAANGEVGVEAGAAAGAGGGPPRRRRAAQRFTARVHVLDVCRAVEASIAAPAPGGAVYNVADADPAGRAEAAAFAAAAAAAARAGRPLGALVAESWRARAERAGGEGAEPAAGAAGGGRWLEEKRVCGARLRRELGLRLEFPSYREGLAALAAGDARPFLDARDARLALGLLD